MPTDELLTIVTYGMITSFGTILTMNKSAKDPVKIQTMFSTIAHRYDLLNKVLSLGIDRHWRKFAVNQLVKRDNAHYLDVATGTCDVSLEIINSFKGARVTGVDFSETAIELARKVAKRGGVEVEFVCSNVYDLPENLEGEFDIVFTSYGVLCWLNDMEEWARIIAHYLKPEGVFLLVESHPFMWVFDDASEELNQKYSYWHNTEPISWEENGTYADENAKITNKKSYEWQHTVSDVLNALIKAGLTIDEIGEYPELVWAYTPASKRVDEEYFRIPGDPLPQCWSVQASKRKV